MKKVSTIIAGCRGDLLGIASCLQDLTALDGARNPKVSQELALQALKNAGLLSSKLRGLIIRYKVQIERTRQREGGR
jgi:hypothetical protein